MSNVNEIKKEIYYEIINDVDIDTEKLINCSYDLAAKKYVKSVISKKLNRFSYKEDEILKLTETIFSENWGLGLIDKYDKDDIDEIMVFGTKIILFKGKEIIEITEQFRDCDETLSIIRRVLEFDKSKDLNAKNAIVEAKRYDGARITAVIPPAGKIPYLNIRKFDSFIPSTENMLKSKTLTNEMINLLKLLVKGRANIVVIGEMGSGKTTFIRWLMQFIPKNLIIGTLETTFELKPEKLYKDRLFVQLEERLPDYPLADLFTVMLRQNVDIIIVGECRSYEVNELIKAMSRGHSGSIGSTHSMDSITMIDDLADMVLESGKNVDIQALKYRIAKAVDIVVKFRKLPNRRKVCAGIYELLNNSDSLNYESIPLIEFDIKENRHIKKNDVSDKLNNKLNSYNYGGD